VRLHCGQSGTRHGLLNKCERCLDCNSIKHRHSIKRELLMRHYSSLTFSGAAARPQVMHAPPCGGAALANVAYLTEAMLCYQHHQLLHFNHTNGVDDDVPDQIQDVSLPRPVEDQISPCQR
jgi:hypothetical protein